MFEDILSSFALQILFSVGMIFLFGALIAFFNRKFYSCFRGRAAIYVTGIVGTPVHELSHALMCLVFRHRIKEIKLFRINSADGTLGYVTHSYNEKSLFQKAGNFFIGVAPILIISLLLSLLYYLLLPLSAKAMHEAVRTSGGNFWTAILGIFSTLLIFFGDMATWRWWLFVFIGSFFALHMTLSRADIKGALSGLVCVLLALLVLDILLRMIGYGALKGFTDFFLSSMMYMVCFFVIALIVSLIAVGAAYVIRQIVRAGKKE